MPIIIKKGTNPSAFKLRNGKTIILQTGFGGGEHLNVISDADYDLLMAEYGVFIRERIISDKNPDGCFIVHDSRTYASAMDKEIGDEITDNSAPLKMTKKPKKKK